MSSDESIRDRMARPRRLQTRVRGHKYIASRCASVTPSADDHPRWFTDDVLPHEPALRAWLVARRARGQSPAEKFKRYFSYNTATGERHRLGRRLRRCRRRKIRPHAEDEQQRPGQSVPQRQGAREVHGHADLGEGRGRRRQGNEAVEHWFASLSMNSRFVIAREACRPRQSSWIASSLRSSQRQGREFIGKKPRNAALMGRLRMTRLFKRFPSVPSGPQALQGRRPIRETCGLTCVFQTQSSKVAARMSWRGSIM